MLSPMQMVSPGLLVKINKCLLLFTNSHDSQEVRLLHYYLRRLHGIDGINVNIHRTKAVGVVSNEKCFQGCEHGFKGGDSAPPPPLDLKLSVFVFFLALIILLLFLFLFLLFFPSVISY